MAKKTIQFAQSFIDEQEQKLKEQEQKLEQELGRFTNPNPNVEGDFEATFPEYGDESDENAREIADYLSNKPLEETLEKTLRDVKKSLERIKKGIYGICKYCDEKIDEKRLTARPTSSSCIGCKKTLTNEA